MSDTHGKNKRGSRCFDCKNKQVVVDKREYKEFYVISVLQDGSISSDVARRDFNVPV